MIKNKFKNIGIEFTSDLALFGVKVLGWEAVKFYHKSGEIAVSLVKDRLLSRDTKAHYFKTEEAFTEWIDGIYEEKGRPLPYGHQRLLFRAFPDFDGLEDRELYKRAGP